MITPFFVLQPNCSPKALCILLPSLYSLLFSFEKPFLSHFCMLKSHLSYRYNLGVTALILLSVTNYSLLVLSDLFPCTILCAIMGR